MNKKLIWICLGVLIATVTAACGHKYVSARADRGEVLSGIKSVAILPFENMTKFPEAGKIVADLLATELYISREYRVMERTEAVAVCAEMGIRVDESVDTEYARQLGEKLGVGGVIIGSVSEYWYRVYREEDEEVEPAVGFSARLISVATGEVVWSASVTRSSYDLLFSRKDPLNRVAQLAVMEMVQTLL
jgi:TolB-like protein